MISILGSRYSEKQKWILNHALVAARDYVCDNTDAEYCEDCPAESRRICNDLTSAIFHTFQSKNPFVENSVENVENSNH